MRLTFNAQNRNSQRPTSAQENLPDQRTRSDGNDQSSNESSKKEDLTNYEISQKTVQTVSDGYAIRRLSVAVLVNRSRLTALAGPEDKAALEKQIAEIEELVGSAAGFSKERGDTILVSPGEGCGNISMHLASEDSNVPRCAAWSVIPWATSRPSPVRSEPE